MVDDMHFEDRRLAQRLLRGESDAFNVFFNQHFNRLFRFAASRVGDDDTARDIVQETLCRALRRMETYRGEAAMFTWLCQICRSQLSDYFEKHQRRARVMVPIDDDPDIQAALDLVAAPDDPEAAQRRQDLSQLIQAVMDRLPAHYGDALEWKYVEGISVAEIATRLGVQHAAAQSLLQRARGMFRTVFEEVYGTAQVQQLFREST